MLQATKFALDMMRNLLGHESEYKTLVLGSLHGLDMQYDTQIDWTKRGIEGNVNFSFDRINSGDWNLVFNCCCEHMYPMREIILPATYVLQSNDHYSDHHLNRCISMDEFITQIDLTEIYHYNTSRFGNHNYFTVIGEKC